MAAKTTQTFSVNDSIRVVKELMEGPGGLNMREISQVCHVSHGSLGKLMAGKPLKDSLMQKIVEGINSETMRLKKEEKLQRMKERKLLHQQGKTPKSIDLEAIERCMFYKLDKKVTLNQFAEMLDVKPSLIKSLNTFAQNPPFHFLIKLQLKLNANLNHIFTGRGPRYLSVDKDAVDPDSLLQELAETKTLVKQLSSTVSRVEALNDTLSSANERLKAELEELKKGNQ